MVSSHFSMMCTTTSMILSICVCETTSMQPLLASSKLLHSTYHYEDEMIIPTNFNVILTFNSW